MARFKTKRFFYNFILILVLLPALLLSLPGLSLAASLALEQQARCGMEEHVHTQDCYLGDVLICTKKMHTHTENCYLVLLEDNDINQLLTTVDNSPDKSLESVITAQLNADDDSTPQAVTLSQKLSDSSSGQSSDSAVVSTLALNDRLTTAETLAEGPTDTAAIYNNGISTLAVGDTAQTGTRAINFYIRLDGNITLINSGTLTNSDPDYYTYADTVAEYKDVVVTNLTTGNIESTYYFRYYRGDYFNYDFDRSPGYETQGTDRLTFGDRNSARYAILTTRSGSNWNGYTYTPVDFYTVTLDYSEVGGTNQVQYVQSGLSSTLTLSTEYNWYDEAGNQVTAIPTITEKTTLYAKPKNFTVTYIDQSGTSTQQGPFSPGTTHTVLAPPTNYRWSDTSGNIYVGGESITTTTTLTANICRVTIAGTEQWVKVGDTVTLPEGYKWSDGTNTYIGGTAVTISKPADFTGTILSYTVTLTDENGDTSTKTVTHGDSVTLPTLPEGYTWYGSDGNSYTGGTTYGPVTSDMTFIAASRTITVNYDVNFPNVSVDKIPTIYGTTSATARDTVIGGSAHITRSLTSRTAAQVSGTERYTYFFQGWTIQGYDDLLIPPDSSMNWNTLEGYDTDGDGVVNLTGVWESPTRANSVSFYVQINSVAVDTDGNITGQPSSNYTPPIFYTHVGGVDTSLSEAQIKSKYELADVSADNSFTVDQEIRALYGEKTDWMWLYDFPTDTAVFDSLKDYITDGNTLYVDGEAVKADELDSTHYAIRWYVLKYEGSAWHIDGRLVKKEGTITIDKAFGGDTDALAAAKSGFKIVAENGVKNADGSFTPYSSSDSTYKHYELTLDQATVNGDSYEWLIEHVTLNEYWRITEYPVDVTGYSYYAEYSVYDTDGEYTAMAEYGTRASVVGKTFALDEDPDQGLLVDFRNYYYPKASVLIKKEDAATGLPIGGAAFELWQDDTLLTFDYDEASGQYVRNEEGTGSLRRITTASDGFSIISTTGFSYEYGDVVVKEVVAPAGYSAAPDVTIGHADDNTTVVLKDVANVSSNDWDDYAEVPDNDVLVVKDHTADDIHVSVKKAWNTNTPASSVEVVLQANGGNAAALFPGLANAQVVLNAANNWSYTWQSLPEYANGQAVTWGVKEVVIGGTPTLSDGVTFANWIVTYSPGMRSDLDGDGKSDDLTFTVTNSSRTPKLILTKVSSDGAVLPGATFLLEQVTLSGGAWQTVAGSTSVTLVTDSNGMITFDQLTAGAYYRLSETGIPEGYFSLFEPVVLTINGVGDIQQVDTAGNLSAVNAPGITNPSAYNVQVVNHFLTTLPETGGVGAQWCAISGSLLMAAALLLLYKSRYGKEEEFSS